MESNFKTIIDSKTPVLIEFYAERCEPCQSLSHVLKQVKSEMGDAIKIVKIDVDKNPLLAASYQIGGIPTMLLFKDGIQVWRESGVHQMSDLIKVVESS